MNDVVTGARGGCAVRDEEAGDGDGWVVEEVFVVVCGESAVFEEFFEALFECLGCVGVFDFSEENGSEVVV
ncbi:hypothetical protein PNP59_14090 [Halobacterium salinarum]|uniref:hypothetical protein n=1 Tax=Halobacterium salinarum TaxID=2242 RepID=UPI002553C62C|nr:hypothetical protein [Halobacterium salinarum]MDL0132036.1 hypothetical protein [Halobacterium salinarum]